MANPVLIGSGGREHAMAEAIARSSAVENLHCLPGNLGMEMVGDNVIVYPDQSATDIGGLSQFAYTLSQHKDEVTVICGPEAPLVAGLGDRVALHGLAFFGPSAEAAKLEGSKIFAAEFMKENDIPMPKSTIVRTWEEALAFLQRHPAEDIVLKDDGLAGGKGVVLPRDLNEALAAAHTMLSRTGKGIVIQERLTGPEFSAFVLSNGLDYTIIPVVAQDHKRLKDGDKGPNTGGMGAYTLLLEEMMDEQQLAALDKIAHNTITGMHRRGTPFKGVVFLGGVLAREYGNKPLLYEYNVRFGDPEGQVIFPMITAAGYDVYQLFSKTARGEVPYLDPARFAGRSALAVCLAAPGYPEAPQKGQIVHGLDREYPDVTIYHGATKCDDAGNIVADGGRVLYVVGQGQNVDDAARAAYAAIGPDGVQFNGMQYRRDIGHQVRSGF